LRNADDEVLLRRREHVFALADLLLRLVEGDPVLHPEQRLARRHRIAVRREALRELRCCRIRMQVLLKVLIIRVPEQAHRWKEPGSRLRQQLLRRRIGRPRGAERRIGDESIAVDLQQILAGNRTRKCGKTECHGKGENGNSGHRRHSIVVRVVRAFFCQGARDRCASQ
jgi:hypothetical protein